MELAHIDKNSLPRHIAVIMDGNGRWAKQHGVRRNAGHEAGAKSVRAIVEGCRDLNAIEALTLYAFSTENWSRSKMEVNALFRLFSKYLRLELDNIHKENIRIVIMGRRTGLPKGVLKDFDRCMEHTAGNTAMTLNVAINYGARGEIVDAAKSIVRDVNAGLLDIDELDEDIFARHLYTGDQPDPDLLIRTSGELRLSNFMLWQLSYAELIVTDVLWPDFGKPNLYDAIAEFQHRKRRFGGRK